MKVYFIATPRGRDGFDENYRFIYKILEELGNKHVTDFILRVDVDKFYLSDIRPFYKKTIKDLKQADVCIFETSIHSLAIGHLISTAIDLGKPVISLYSGKNLPFFLSGVEEEKIQIVNYDTNNLERLLKHALEYALEKQDARFNFFISKKIASYLDWIAKNRRIPRAVYLRQLITREMRKYREFES